MTDETRIALARSALSRAQEEAQRASQAVHGCRATNKLAAYILRAGAELAEQVESVRREVADRCGEEFRR